MQDYEASAQNASAQVTLWAMVHLEVFTCLCDFNFETLGTL